MISSTCVLHQAGTTAEIFLLFIQGLIARLAITSPGVRRTFLWDNLRSHYSDAVAFAIYSAGHRIINRPAYYPQDGPIEYIFNRVEMGLRDRLYLIRHDDQLIWHTHDIISGIHAVEETFVHCGY